MGKYFGTDGFRGEANVSLHNYQAYRIGRFLGWYFGGQRQARIVIGKDTRRSGYMLEYAIAAGLSASGASANMLHVIPTPGVAYVTRSENFDCGIMLTASHNPYYDNGIKLFDSYGEKMAGSTIDLLEKYLDGYPMSQDIEGRQGVETSYDKNALCGIPLAQRQNIGKVEDYFAGRNRYVAYLLHTATRSFMGLKVGLDTANGASYAIARNVFEALGAKVFMIGNTPNGLNINVRCGSTCIKKLQNLVKAQGLDVGFAFDGDADRCIAVDHTGRIVNGDGILYLCATYMKQNLQLDSYAIATTVMSNGGVIDSLSEQGIKCIKTDVGDKYVYAAMKKHELQLGGEQSGHIVFRKYSTTGDGILTAMRIAQIMLDKKSALSTLLAPLKLYPQVLINLSVREKDAVLTDKEVLNAINAGTACLVGRGKVLVRKSGTEDKIRILVEAEKRSLARQTAKNIECAIRQGGYVCE